MLHAILCPFAVSSIPLTSSGAVSNWTWVSMASTSPDRIFNCRLLSGRQAEGAAHDCGSRGGLECRLQLLSLHRIQLVQSADEGVRHLFLKVRCGEVRQCFSRDGKYFLSCSAGEFFAEVLMFASSAPPATWRARRPTPSARCR